MIREINLFVYAKSLDKLSFKGLVAAKFFIGCGLMQNKKYASYSEKFRIEMKADPRMLPPTCSRYDFNLYSACWGHSKYKIMEKKLGEDFLYYRLREIYVEIEKRLGDKNLPKTNYSSFVFCRRCGGLATGDHIGNYTCECGNYGERIEHYINDSIGRAEITDWEEKNWLQKRFSKKPEITEYDIEYYVRYRSLTSKPSYENMIAKHKSYEDKLSIAFCCAINLCAISRLENINGKRKSTLELCENWVDFLNCKDDIAIVENYYANQGEMEDALEFYYFLFLKMREEFEKDFCWWFELVAEKPVAYIEPACTCTCEACIKARESHVS